MAKNRRKNVKTAKYLPGQLEAVLDLRNGSRSRPMPPKKQRKMSTRADRKSAAMREYT